MVVSEGSLRACHCISHYCGLYRIATARLALSFPARCRTNTVGTCSGSRPLSSAARYSDWVRVIFRQAFCRANRCPLRALASPAHYRRQTPRTRSLVVRDRVSQFTQYILWKQWFPMRLVWQNTLFSDAPASLLHASVRSLLDKENSHWVDIGNCRCSPSQ
jgi:hypothetical protein